MCFWHQPSFIIHFPTSSLLLLFRCSVQISESCLQRYVILHLDHLNLFPTTDTAVITICLLQLTAGSSRSNSWLRSVSNKWHRGHQDQLTTISSAFILTAAYYWYSDLPDPFPTIDTAFPSNWYLLITINSADIPIQQLTHWLTRPASSNWHSGYQDQLTTINSTIFPICYQQLVQRLWRSAYNNQQCNPDPLATTDTAVIPICLLQ